MSCVFSLSKAEHSDRKSQVMETFVMVQSGQVISVKGAVQLFTAVSTILQQVLNSTVAAVIYRTVATLGFGATGILVMVQ